MVSSARQHVAVVDGIRKMAKDTWAIRLRQPDLAQQITPGQFFMLRPADGSDPLLGRPFALYDTYTDEDGRLTGVEFGFVVVGKLTSLMTRWKVGDTVEVWGPLGNGFPVPSAKHLICVAGGIGQTPFMAVAAESLGLKHYGSPYRQLPELPDSVTLCYGVRSQEYLSGLDDFALPGLHINVATDDGSYGHHGFVTELVQQQLDGDEQDIEVYCCGPEPMMKAVAEVCSGASVKCWMSLETPMACGFGACFSCVTKVKEDDGTWDYRRTCVEGPVFEAERLVL
ncbi:MAG: dihydroorotate dehydrogenase electron transfer subunit [Fuerstiella sp.]|nr:dihydroorotate dehydrogenase electron transfer subunit [Fuerstiella sp.]MCP4786920.1 dihydroorotate dehydrogenase electron transfer subunit [Fuerstiella sp.]MCP4859272.1 dihydroorotate dehydrogenase electron transfer subunit [Fuerstiella sp.]